MRLFVAINFDDEVKNRLCQLQEVLRDDGVTGNFSSRDNLHLTMVFIGEVPPDTVSAALAVVRAVSFSPLRLDLSRAGFFADRRRPDERLLWVGSRRLPVLEKVHQNLCNGLDGAGISFDRKRFVSHVTLGRRCLWPQAYTYEERLRPWLPIFTTVDHLSLMKSERLPGKLVYTELS